MLTYSGYIATKKGPESAIFEEIQTISQPFVFEALFCFKLVLCSNNLSFS